MSSGTQHAVLAEPVSLSTLSVPSPAPGRAVSPAHPPGCSQRSPRKGGLQPFLSPFLSPLSAHPASLFLRSVRWDPSSPCRDWHLHTCPKAAARQLPGVGGCLYALAFCPWLRRPCSSLASKPPGSTCSSHHAADAVPAVPLPACPPLPVSLSLPLCPAALTATAPRRGAGAPAPQAACKGAAMARGARGTWPSPAASHLPAGSRPGQEKPEIP